MIRNDEMVKMVEVDGFGCHRLPVCRLRSIQCSCVSAELLKHKGRFVCDANGNLIWLATGIECDVGIKPEFTFCI